MSAATAGEEAVAAAVAVGLAPCDGVAPPALAAGLKAVEPINLPGVAVLPVTPGFNQEKHTK